MVPCLRCWRTLSHFREEAAALSSRPAREASTSEQEPHLEAEPGLCPVGGAVRRPGDGAAEVNSIADRLTEARADVEVRHAATFLDVIGFDGLVGMRSSG